MAASLELAKSQGATQSVLFTPAQNTPAIRAYEALGYRHFGEWGLVMWIGA